MALLNSLPKPSLPDVAIPLASLSVSDKDANEKVVVSSAASGEPEQEQEEVEVDKIFMIGGAQLYSQSLTLIDPSFRADRILITRILEPTFDDCDAFFPEFRSIEKSTRSEEITSAKEDSAKDEWQRSTHQELEAFVGFDVAEGVQEEKDVKYEFQMWVR